MDLYSNPEILERYLEAHCTPEDPVLAALNRHTYLKEAYPRMLSGHVLGSFLTLFASLLSPSRILEIGTYTGYSAICLARGLGKDGKLITLEVNDEYRETALHFIRKAKLEDRIEIKLGDAKMLIPTLKDEFDLVFLDAHKEDYVAYYHLVMERLKPGGYILADNVLWGGKVLDPEEKDSTTAAIRNFNRIIAEDQRVLSLLLPLRDGLMIIKKR